MEKKQIVFTEINKAELLTKEVEELQGDSVRECISGSKRYCI